MFPEILIIVLLLGILLYLIISFKKSSDKYGAGPETGSFQDDDENTTPCPLCRKALYKGERVHSQIYSRGDDRLMNIYGCPWCYKDHPAGHREPLRERRCPSCGVLLKEGSFAVARVFERPGRKTHVHVLGCPVCRHMK